MLTHDGLKYFPPPPKGTGVRREDLDSIPNVWIEPRFQLCEDLYCTSRLEPRAESIGCTHGFCRRITDITLMRQPEHYVSCPPRQFKLSCVSWVPDLGRSFDLNSEDLYPTKWTRAITSGRRLNGPGSICRNFHFSRGLCSYWENCNFVHAKHEVVHNILKHYVCPDGEDCVHHNRYKTCPYKHLESFVKITIRTCSKKRRH